MEECLHQEGDLYYYDVYSLTSTRLGRNRDLLYRLPITKHQFEAWNGTAPRYYQTQARNAVTRALLDRKHN